MDYKRNSKYFKPMNLGLAIVACIIGLPLLGTGDTVVAGLVLIAVGILLIVLKVKGTPKDADIDAVTAGQIADLKARALRKLGLDEDEVSEITPISFDGYVYDKTAMIKRGKDGKYRSNK